MSIVRTVAKGIAWNTAAAGVGKILVVFNLFIILRTLSVYEYGLSELVLSVVSMLSILLLPGLGTAIIADMAYEKTRGDASHARSLLIQFYILSFVLGVVAWAVLFFGSGVAADLVGNPTISTFLKIVSFLFLLSPMRMVTTILATVERRFADQAFFGVVEEMFKAVGLLFFLVYLGHTVDGLLYASVLGQACAIVVFLPRTFSAFTQLSGRGGSYKFWNILHQHRKWSIAGTYVSSLTQTVQIWLIRMVLGTEAVGLYSVAAGVLSQVSTLLPFGTILAPIVPAYVHMKNHLCRLIVAALKIQTALAASLYIVTIASLPLFVIIFPHYRGSAWMIPILLIGLLPLGFLSITGPVFAALKEQRSFVESAGLKLVLTTICFPIGMLVFGLTGLAIANVFVLCVSAVERWMRLSRISPELTIRLSDLIHVSGEERKHAEILLKSFINKLRIRPHAS